MADHADCGWHLWLGSEVKRPRCEVCRSRWFVFRYTNSDLDVWTCWPHRSVAPGKGRAER